MSKFYDPRMHTAEHILNRTMQNLLGTDRCFSAHINPKKSKCDYRFDRNLTTDEIADIQAQVNRVIREDLPVTEEQMSREAAMAAFNLGRVPDVENLASFRIVRVGDYDACPCIGPHVAFSGEIGSFRITTTSYEDGVLRIRFRLKHQ